MRELADILGRPKLMRTLKAIAAQMPGDRFLVRAKPLLELLKKRKLV